MATLTVSSGLDGFRLITAIRRMDRRSIDGVASLDHAPAFAGLEAMAQLAALHVRRRIDFSRHAFLLKVVTCQGFSRDPLHGGHRVHARLQGHGSHAFRYAATAIGDAGHTLVSELLIGVRDYDDQFQTHRLQDYYRKLVDDLYGASVSPGAGRFASDQ